jgi:hypothetical protein
MLNIFHITAWHQQKQLITDTNWTRLVQQTPHIDFISHGQGLKCKTKKIYTLLGFLAICTSKCPLHLFVQHTRMKY